MEGKNWFGVLVPTPSAIVTLLNREIVNVIALPDMREWLAALGLKPVGSTPKEFADRIAIELDKWGNVIRLAKGAPSRRYALLDLRVTSLGLSHRVRPQHL